MDRVYSNAEIRLKRIKHAALVATVVAELRLAGIRSPLNIADALNARGILNLNGKVWTQIEVMRLDKRPKIRNEPLKRVEWHPEKFRN